MQLAAILPIWLSNSRLHQNKSHNSDGMVKVMCCQGVLGNKAFCLAIQSSVAFFPKEEQALHLQV